MKMETTAEFMGRQYGDMVNYSVSPSASGTPPELQLDRWPVQFAASNIFQLEVELQFEGELPCSTYASQVLQNQGRKVANLSDRGLTAFPIIVR